MAWKHGLSFGLFHFHVTKIRLNNLTSQIRIAFIATTWHLSFPAFVNTEDIICVRRKSLNQVNVAVSRILISIYISSLFSDWICTSCRRILPFPEYSEKLSVKFMKIILSVRYSIDFITKATWEAISKTVCLTYYWLIRVGTLLHRLTQFSSSIHGFLRKICLKYKIADPPWAWCFLIQEIMDPSLKRRSVSRNYCANKYHSIIA